MTRRIVEALPADVVERLHALVAVDLMEDDDLVGAWRLRADQVGAGNVSLDSMLTPDPQAAGGPRGRPPGRPVRRRRAEGRRGLAGSGRGGIWIAPA